MATIAAGLASMGYSPFIYSIANFPLLRAFEQVRNDVVHENFPVTLVSIGTGFDYGNLGYSHHSLEDIGAAFALQGLQVYSPATQLELKDTVEHLSNLRAPTYLRLSKFEAPHDLGGRPKGDLEPYLIRGHADCIIGLASYGSLVPKLTRVAGLIESSIGVDVGVISLPKLRFVTSDIFTTFRHIFLVEEQTQNSGMAGHFFGSLNRIEHLRSIHHVGLGDVHRESNGNEEEIRAQHGFSIAGLAERIERLISAEL